MFEIRYRFDEVSTVSAISSNTNLKTTSICAWQLINEKKRIGELMNE
jgi:hypothetical protein